MGIQGLLPFFEKVQKNVNLKEFSGKRVAVDGNVWLHRGAFACAQELALNQPTTTYVTYFMKQLDLLAYCKVEPVIVFDGKSLPIKSHTNEQRRTKREEAKKLGSEHLRHGRLDQAKEAFQKAINITPQMVTEVIKMLDARHIECIQAPYEADPQLTLLCKKGYVSAVISEDSDLLVHGCPTVLFKMNAYGDCTLIHNADLFTNLGNGFDFTNWTQNKLRHWCILSGCDYLPSAPGVGLKTAYKYLNFYKTATGVIKFLRQKGKILDRSYESGFAKANDAFLYQHVYVPGSRVSIHLTTLPNGKTGNDYTYLGKRPLATVSGSRTGLGDEVSPSGEARVVKKRKTNDCSALGSITNTYGQTPHGTTNASSHRHPKGDDPDNITTTKQDDKQKENIAPWFATLIKKQEQPVVTTPRPSQVSTIRRVNKRPLPETMLTGTSTITPSPAGDLMARLTKRIRSA